MTRAPSRLRTVTCAQCGASFETRHSQGKYCSDECRRLGARETWVAYGDRNRSARRASSKRIYRESRDRVLARQRAYNRTDAGKATMQRASEVQRRRFPEKVAARQAVKVALIAGKLTRKPCERCGARRVHAHHHDYAKPLDVIWLCPPCHRAEHATEETPCT